MNKQLNLRLPENLLKKATAEAKKRGFANVQELIKDNLRKSLFESQGVTAEELSFLKKIYKVSEEKNLYGTEKDLLKKLNKK
jgi:Arc/MetJ-type ribon-helix-helix transcriptional regulator